MVAAKESRIELVILFYALKVAIDAALSSILKHRVIKLSLVESLRSCLDGTTVEFRSIILSLLLLIHEAELL